MNRRSRLEVNVDIMTALTDGPKSPTRLMYRTNLSWAPLQECLSYLLTQGLVEESKHSFRRKLYGLTEKGKNLLSQHADLMKELNHNLLGEEIKTI
ncbi:MAG: winged helix-turn-helix domain-containing protein [Nitrososphaerales archaeon]